MDQPYHDPADEPIASQLDPSFFDFDNGDPGVTKEDLKVLIYQEITRPDPDAMSP